MSDWYQRAYERGAMVGDDLVETSCRTRPRDVTEQDRARRRAALDAALRSASAKPVGADR